MPENHALRRILFLMSGVVLCLFVCGSASAISIYGALSNFDVFNDTGHLAHGFEIELDGVSASQVLYEFQSPNIRYHAPSITPFAGGVFVRWESTYTNNAWDQTTQMAPSVITPTIGHQCWVGGSPTTYPTMGCEHFGVSVSGNATNTVYQWLIEGATPGSLIKAGSAVNIPAPVWSVPPGPPVVHAVIPAPPPPAPALFGPAEYMKVFYTENAGPVELNEMVHGNPNVLNDSETEIEWFLLQRGLNDELDNGQQPGAGADSVVRRYEFYKYVGPYDSDGQALCEDPTTAGCESSLGNYIGSQMAGVNLVPNGPGPVPEPGTFALMGAALVGAMFLRRRSPRA